MFTDEQRAAIASLRSIWPEQRIVLIGAGALRAHRKLTRFTADLDLAIAIEGSDYPGPLAESVEWRADSKQHQRWRHSLGTEVDIIPAGPSLRAQGHISWPSGHRMSLEGFATLFSAPLEFVNAGLRIELPTVAMIVLLKMVAWLDRPAERARDLDDLAFLFTEYLDEANDAEFALLLEAFELGYTGPHTAQAFLLGRDVARCEGAGLIAQRFLLSLSTTHRWMFGGMRSRGPAALAHDEAFESIWASFEQGLRSQTP
jgi:predicted nucleotidyltransferase